MSAPRPTLGFRRTMLLNGAVPIAVLILLGALLAFQFWQMNDQRSSFAHSLEVERQATHVKAVLEEMESGQRGFLITGRVGFLQPFIDGSNEFTLAIASLQEQVRRDPDQLAAAQRIDEQKSRWRQNAQFEIFLKATQSRAFLPYFSAGRGANIMIGLRNEILAFQSVEERLRERREARAQAATLVTAIIGGCGLLLAIAFFSLFSLRQYRLLDAFHLDTIHQLEAQTEELGTQTEEMLAQQVELHVLYDELRQHNATVEREVTLRTEELARAKDGAEEASRAKSMFLANMSHELRTPLNAIIGYSEMLVEEAQDVGQEGFVPDLNKVNHAGKHLLNLINGILDLSKIEAGKMELYLEEVDLASTVTEVIGMLQSQVEKQGNTLALALPDRLPRMQADATKLRQVLFNLLSNANKFTERGALSLAVTAEGDGATDWIRFEIADAGIGMSSEQVANLFQDFHQADASTTRRYGGTGLGLAISQRFCHLMGGTIHATSVVGRGTKFVVRLPVVAPALVTPPTADGRHAPVPHEAPTVLAIDDDADTLALLSRILAKEGFALIAATTGEEGLALARAHGPRAITLDVKLHGMDGWSVLSALKADPLLSAIPVVMLTMVDDRPTGFALGAAEYLVKPVDRAHLARVLGELVPGRPGAGSGFPAA